MRNEFRKTVAVFDLPCGPLMRTYEKPLWEKTQEEVDKSYFAKRKKKKTQEKKTHLTYNIVNCLKNALGAVYSSFRCS